MTKEQAQEFRDRWQAVNAIEVAEQQAATVQQRWHELNALWEEARLLGLPLQEAEDVEVVRARWVRLKELEV